jgi:signal transduction histidine kinase
LPPPRRGQVDVDAWIRRTAELAKVDVVAGPAIAVAGDADQLDQMLINLVRNAAEASAETGGGVRVRWSVAGDNVTVTVEDDGPGVADTANLFVPFFTTKATGSGIGLVLARQIAEAHHGNLVVRNRDSAPGAEAVVTLPI